MTRRGTAYRLEMAGCMAVLATCEVLLLLDPGWTRDQVTLAFGALAVLAVVCAAVAVRAHLRDGAR
jgi:hypothetical protein